MNETGSHTEFLTGPDILNLPNLAATANEIVDGVTQIIAEPRHRPFVCTTCGSTHLTRHGVRPQQYADAPNYGKPTIVVVNRRRWRCQTCKAMLRDPLPDMDENRPATKRLIEYIRGRCFSHTFAEISREVRINDKTVRAIFDDYVAELEASIRFETPRVLGIDEVKVIGKYRCILTNVEANAVFDFLPSRTMKELHGYFQQFPDRKDVEVFTADLWNNYATVARKYFPHATFVADRFHVQRMASNALEVVRKQVRSRLSGQQRIKLKNDRLILLMNGSRLSAAQRALIEEWSALFPALGMAYRVKEAFVAVWEHQDRHTAGDALSAWVRAVPPEMTEVFRELINVVTSRRQDILAYFDHRITNAYTESVNRLVKSMNRAGRGYTFEVLRAKLLYDTNALKKTMKQIPIYRTDHPTTGNRDDSAFMGRMIGFQQRPTRTVIGYRTVEYGPHIPTLCDLLEAGYFEQPGKAVPTK